MVDNTLCLNKHCPLAKKCWRYTTMGDEEQQSLATFYYDWMKRSCEQFVPLEKKKRKR
jgi:hypothetical protein